MKKQLSLLAVLLGMILISCENEEVELVTVNEDEIIPVNSVLYDDMKSMVEDELVCLDFIYDFTVKIYNEELLNVDSQIVRNDSEFLNILTGLPESYSLNLSFPIQGTSPNGEILTIENKDELQINIKGCLKDEFLEYCFEILTKSKCVWRVTDNNSDELNYTNAFFEIDDTGVTNFFYEGEEFSGTWILFYIEDELHLNIYLEEEESEVAIDWNYDWLVILEEEDHMLLTTEGSDYELIEKCNTETECNNITFESCRNEDNETIFELNSFAECIYNYLDYSETQNIALTFHETLEDAQDNLNTISDFYTILVESYFLVARLENTESESTEFLYIKLNGIDCE